jgi:CheY-like chemotaxis protein
LPHVFELFTQAERTLDRAQGGLGIGLTLVKLLVEMHGGSVEASSAGLGHGAEFIVRLPAGTDAAAAPWEAPAAQVLPNAPQRQEAAMRILIVDDNADAADSIAMLLSMDGYEAHSVHGARAALEAAPSFKPHVVLLDIGLPEMDGYEVARKLRSLDSLGTVKLVALTGYGQAADRERAAQAGFDEYLVKPVEPTVLNEFLRSLRPE